jgi:hypothetical protein
MTPTPRRRRRSRPRAYISANEIIIVLRKLEQHRAEIQHHQQSIAAYTNMLQGWLATSDEFAAAWQEFCEQGGLSASDYHAFVHGCFQPRPLECQKHLRLVADNDKPPEE